MEYSAATAATIATAINTAVNTGAGTATLVLETSGDVEVATVNLQNPAFSVSANVLTLLGVTLSDASAIGGEIAQASIYDRDAAKVAEIPLAEMTVSNTTVGVGVAVDVTGLTITVPAL